MSTALKTASRGPGGIAFSLAVACLSLLILLNGCAATGPGTTAGLGLDRAELAAQRAAQPDEPYWAFMLADGSRARGDFPAARAYLDTALTLDPDYAPAVALLSKIQYDTGQYDAAVSLLQAALERESTAPDALRVALALNLQALENSEAAAAVLATCEPQNGPARTARIAGLLQSDDFAGSLPEARAALAADPASAANHNNLGVSLLYAGQAVAARDEFVAALALAPELPGALYNLAIVENFYFFNRDSSRDYFQRYQVAAHQQPAPDPDDLSSLLAGPATVGGAQALLSSPLKGAGHE